MIWKETQSCTKIQVSSAVSLDPDKTGSLWSWFEVFYTCWSNPDNRIPLLPLNSKFQMTENTGSGQKVFWEKTTPPPPHLSPPGTDSRIIPWSLLCVAQLHWNINSAKQNSSANNNVGYNKSFLFYSKLLTVPSTEYWKLPIFVMSQFVTEFQRFLSTG